MQNLLRWPWMRLGAAQGVMVLTIAVAVAALLAAIALAHNFFVAPWPYDTGRIGVLTHRSAESTRASYGFSAGEYRAVRDSGLFAATSASRSLPVQVAVGEALPQRQSLVFTESSAREVGGTAPLLGRFIDPAQPDAVVVSHAFWQEAMGGRSDVLGSRLRIDGVARTVIGVMPPRYHFLGGDLWTAHPGSIESEASAERRYVINVLAHTSGSLAPLAADLARIATATAAQGPREHYSPGWTIEAQRVIDAVMGPLRPAVGLLLAAAGLMLGVALVNVAILLSLRQLARSPELATRLALGARPRRLLADALAENLVLALLGVGIGWLLGGLAFEQGVALISHDWIPRELEGQFRYAGASLFWLPPVALLCALLMTAAQWPRLRRLAADGALRGSVRSGAAPGLLRGVRLLATLQVGAAGLVGVLAGCVLLGADEVQQRDSGMRVADTLSARLAWPAGRPASRSEREAFLAQALQVLRAQPGVTAAAWVDAPPFQRFTRVAPVSIDTADAPQSVSAGLRGALGGVDTLLDIPLLQGRRLQDSDGEGREPVVLVNQRLARLLWGDQPPLGRSLRLPGDAEQGLPPRRVVGVLADAHYHGVVTPVEPLVVAPLAQTEDTLAVPVLLLRGTPGQLPALDTSLRALLALDEGVSLYAAASLADRARETLAGLLLAERVFLAFALLSGALAVLGCAVVLHFLLAVRRREYAVRAAVGAAPVRLFRRVLAEGLRIATLGTVAGVALGWLALLLVDRALGGLVPWQPLAALAVAMGLLLLSLLAASGPGLRAARLPAAEALRS